HCVIAMYLGWAYLPKEVLDSMGITYYPSKYWSLALPIWLFVLIIYLYIAFFAINLYNTAPFDSFNTITGA
ncbi:PIG-P protein, partial [Lobosporangium transversale]